MNDQHPNQANPSESHAESQPLNGTTEETENKLPIKTYHCRFCSHLLIASTRDLLSSTTPLRRRRQYIAKGGEGEGGEGGLDGALILEIPSSNTPKNKRRKVSEDHSIEESDPVERNTQSTTTAPGTNDQEAEKLNRKPEQAHYTILLSTLIPDTNPVIIRREDGVVVGYELATGNTPHSHESDGDEEDEFNRKNTTDRAIYLLPGSIVRTEDLEVGLEDTGVGGDVLNAIVEKNAVLKGMEREWMDWVK
ncbi:hypothetical protein TSTA_039160 [Talaromyces stipitatus ATCC 10500]|uniref:Uncharacterized protein n=1 Tax=Talaromyces stipitatus (strain ATCC 10500 / CBS 375.48 / QM 6759 / NRRL 1006) TaxID=441959 RepID=B8M3X0_TALSN|nr:uncharacterized protein TSTA_039160 [Talaromyces stipitatus ATCC 10500]EED20713.1 hypothetical protein TSTA_039160 [Talaromyces stipitatus ATCC 10500]